MLRKIRKTSYVVALVYVQICLHVSLMGAVDSTGHAGPGALEGQNAFNVIAVNLLAGNGVNDGGLNTKEWERSTAGFCRRDTSQRSDDVRASLSLPVCLGLKYQCFEY
jgi:hypothetical protein